MARVWKRKIIFPALNKRVLLDHRESRLLSKSLPQLPKECHINTAKEKVLIFLIEGSLACILDLLKGQMNCEVVLSCIIFRVLSYFFAYLFLGKLISAAYCFAARR